MKYISNKSVSDLLRLIPVVIDTTIPEESLKRQNAIGQLKILLKKLKKK